VNAAGCPKSNEPAREIKLIPPGDEPYTSEHGITEAHYRYNGDDWANPDTPHALEQLEPLKLRKGMILADVGAGIGPHSWAVSGVVGPSGRVLAIDTNPLAIQLMRKRLAKHPPAHENLEILHSHPWNIGLSRTAHNGKVHRAIMINTHFFGETRPEWLHSCLRSILLALRPGGVLAVVEDVTVPRDHIVKPMRAVGFQVLGPVAKLPRNMGKRRSTCSSSDRIS